MNFITGTIYNHTDKMFFSSAENSHMFCFMSKNCDDAIGEGLLTIPCEDKLTFGKTSDDRQIAIYTGTDDLELFSNQGFHSFAYVLSNRFCTDFNFRMYDAISFYGGTIKKVFSPKGLVFQYANRIDTESARVPAEYNNDHRIFTIKQKEDSTVSIDIGSTVKLSKGDDGNTIDNSEVVLTLSFSKPQQIGSFFSYYQIIVNLLSFMTYRQNVEFDRVTIHRLDSESEFPKEQAEVFIEKDGNITNKEAFRCIRIEDLGESFTELARIAFIKPDDKDECDNHNGALPPRGIIPEDDYYWAAMSSSKIREICSAIEYELRFVNDINVKENQQIMDLCSEVKKTIKDYRKSNRGLSNDAYNAIFGNLKHWSLPLRERIVALCQKYEPEIGIMAMSLYGKSVIIDSTAVKDFVDFRNDITHNGMQVLSQPIMATALLLSGVVYCCVLERIGVPRSVIQRLCSKGMLR